MDALLALRIMYDLNVGIFHLSPLPPPPQKKKNKRKTDKKWLRHLWYQTFDCCTVLIIFR